MTTTETAVAVRSRQEGDSSAPAVNQKETQGIMARLGRWLERDHWPAPADTIALFSARLTDVAAHKLAKQWSLRYSATEAQERRVLLAGLAHARSSPEPRGDTGMAPFRRLDAPAA